MARSHQSQREQTYRERALKLFPWICAHCGRDFDGKKLSQLTVHHKDHNHQNNPPDGSNWELLCLYCHDNEHQKLLEAGAGRPLQTRQGSIASHNPFADLKAMLEKKQP